MKNKDESL
jgi:hypothetical protein